MIFVILFGRLVTIFKGTTFKVSKSKIVIFVVTVTPVIMATLIGTILFYGPYTQNQKKLGLLILVCTGTAYAVWLIVLNGLFINKLVRVYKANRNSTAANERLIRVITKTSILCFTSTWCTILFIGTYFLKDAINSPHYYLFTGLLLFIDNYTNYWSVLLTFKHFEHWYMRLCGFNDRKCFVFWNRCVNKGYLIELKMHSAVARQSEVSNDVQINSNSGLLTLD